MLYRRKWANNETLDCTLTSFYNLAAYHPESGQSLNNSFVFRFCAFSLLGRKEIQTSGKALTGNTPWDTNWTRGPETSSRSANKVILFIAFMKIHLSRWTLPRGKRPNSPESESRLSQSTTLFAIKRNQSQIGVTDWAK